MGQFILLKKKKKKIPRIIRNEKENFSRMECLLAAKSIHSSSFRNRSYLVTVC